MLEDILKGKYMEGGEPFYNKSRKKYGVLMFHGLTATPDQMRPLGDQLYKKGFRKKRIPNLAPVIAGHSTKREDLFKTTRKDWMDSARNAYEQFNKEYEKTIVLGFSMGGLLALNLAYEYNPLAIISISTPYKLNPQGNIKQLFKPRPINDDLRYKKGLSLKLMYETVKFSNETKKITKHLTQPTLIIQGSEDLRVSIQSPFNLYSDLKSETKEVMLFPGEDHHVLRGKYKNRVFRHIYDFIIQTV